MSYNTRLDYYETGNLQSLQAIQRVGQPQQITMQGLTPNTDYTCQAYLLQGVQEVAQSLQSTFRTVQVGSITLTHQSTTKGNNGEYTVVYSIQSTYAVSSASMAINSSTVQGVVSGSTATFVVYSLVAGNTYPFTVTAYDIYNETATASGSIAIPSDISSQYFTITNRSNSTNPLKIYACCESANQTPTPDTFYYSEDLGNTWTEIRDSANGTTINIPKDGSILLKHNGELTTELHTQEYSYLNWHVITSTSYFEVSGNPMSLIYGDNFRDPSNTVPSYGLHDLFYRKDQSNGGLISAANLYMGTPIESGSSHNFMGMFYKCIMLADTPTLPLTSLGDFCYDSMFLNCSRLRSAPALPAADIPYNAYRRMFYGCTSLTKAPDLESARTVGDLGMGEMFNGCTSLVTAPDISGITRCEQRAFANLYNQCRGLQIAYAPTIDFANAPNLAFNYWLNTVSSKGTLYADASIADTIPLNDPSGCPGGWVVEPM